MTEPYTGGCACGAIRYEIAAEPLMMLDCQCRQCQQESGTGHASHLTFARLPGMVSGAATVWTAVGDGGTVKARAFCPICGSPVYMTFPDNPDFLVIRAASLDDPSRYAPRQVLWTHSAQVWDHVDPGLPAFEKMPPG
ncbi:MAG: Glutathione-dependent formaldehyde-activating [Devosia sp.]|nr:Glutathione-dependent formaldehyde-activating [Devosia sp.]